MRNTPRRVAILVPAPASWAATVLGGFRRYAHGQGNWHLFSSPSLLHGEEDLLDAIRSLRGWKGEALLVASNDRKALRRLRGIGIPAVNIVAGMKESCGVPRVLVNNFRAGHLAADHLLGQGMRRLAFFGWRSVWYSEQRWLGFVKGAMQSGATCQRFTPSREKAGQSWQERIQIVAEWVSSLARPVGVFAVSDFRAQLLIEACHQVGLRIPEDLAVIGMDNDETICEHTIPTLTSVSRNSGQVGWKVGALLDRMMRGEPAPGEDLLVEPDGVVARQSTDRLYSEEPVVQRALDYLRSHLETHFNIAHLAEHLGVSKRTLEMRFRESLQSSPHDFLIWLRVQRAQTLLKLPQERSIAQTARECGFGTISGFYAAFQRLTGESPGRFRRKQVAASGTARRD